MGPGAKVLEIQQVSWKGSWQDICQKEKSAVWNLFQKIHGHQIQIDMQLLLYFDVEKLKFVICLHFQHALATASPKRLFAQAWPRPVAQGRSERKTPGPLLHPLEGPAPQKWPVMLGCQQESLHNNPPIAIL